MPPERIVDVLALMGDAVDNIPGVAGIGDKGARDLVREFGAVEAVLENADKVKRAAYREGLKNHRDDALLSKRLATLRSDVPIALDLEALRRQEPDRAAAHALFTELEFARPRQGVRARGAAVVGHHRLASSGGRARGPGRAARTAAGRVSVAVVVTATEPMRAQLLGLALATAPGGATYVPLGHASLDGPAEVAPAPCSRAPAAAPRETLPSASSPPTPSATSSLLARAGITGGAGLRRDRRLLPAQPRPACLQPRRALGSSSWASVDASGAEIAGPARFGRRDAPRPPARKPTSSCAWPIP